MTDRGIINFDDFVEVALRNIRFSSKSHRRLIEGFYLPPQDYYNWGPVPELTIEDRKMYIRDAKIASTYFTPQGIIKEWYVDVQNGNHIDTMSWYTPLSVIHQTTSHHRVEAKVCTFYCSIGYQHTPSPNETYTQRPTSFRVMISDSMALLIERQATTRFVIFY